MLDSTGLRLAFLKVESFRAPPLFALNRHLADLFSRVILEIYFTMSFRSLLFPALFLLFFTSLVGKEGQPPNVLVILTDDQGWGDLSVHGNKNLATPNIDSIAKDGASFENFYVCRVCAPTRAEFLTGRYAPRTGVTGVTEGLGRLSPDETTIANLFHDAGYATGAFGKWHNGTQSPYHPIDRGFDEFYGFTSGHWSHYFNPPLDQNQKTVRGDGYIVEDITNHAIRFLEGPRDNPFFCYVPFPTPHSPMMVEDEFYEKFDGIDPAMLFHEEGKEDLAMTRAALAMVENIDRHVGRLLNTLTKLKVAENTIVIFFCDNGPNSYRWNGGMKGRKGAIDEGGVRSPLFLRWTEKIEGGTHISEVTGAIDLLPTLRELAGLEGKTANPIDGRSFAPLLLRPTPEWEPRLLFSTRNKDVSARGERFRLDASGRLFDLNTDRGQTTNVASKHPQIVVEWTKAASVHRKEMATARERFADRPYTVGWSPRTVLPARDGKPHGEIQRSSKAPNCSFFVNWSDPDDSITWDIEVNEAGEFEAIVHYTCRTRDVGALIQLGIDGRSKVETTVTTAFNPPLYDKSKERVAESHYFMKDFRPLMLGRLAIPKGRHTLRLSSPQFPGERVIDVHSIELLRR